MTPILQNLPPLLMTYSDWGITVLRVAVGVILLAHGIPKAKNLRGTGEWFASVGFRPGVFWATVAAVVEAGGGLLLISGIFVQLAAFLIAGEFAVIILWHLKRKDPASTAELDLIIFAAALALLTLGGGAWTAF